MEPRNSGQWGGAGGDALTTPVLTILDRDAMSTPTDNEVGKPVRVWPSIDNVKPEEEGGPTARIALPTTPEREQ
jgi:hypothetical protein